MEIFREFCVSDHLKSMTAKEINIELLDIMDISLSYRTIKESFAEFRRDRTPPEEETGSGQPNAETFKKVDSVLSDK